MRLLTTFVQSIYLPIYQVINTDLLGVNCGNGVHLSIITCSPMWVRIILIISWNWLSKCIKISICSSIWFALQISWFYQFFKSSAIIIGFPKIAVCGPARPGHVVITWIEVCSSPHFLQYGVSAIFIRNRYIFRLTCPVTIWVKILSTFLFRLQM